MSKAVKKVGRAIGKVVNGVFKAVKKFANSTVGKIIIGAATIYFGGAALMGAMGGASAGTGFMGTLSGALQGAGAGISGAWSGLTGAASAAMGGNFAAAGSSLSGGLTGAYGAGSGAVLGTGTGLTVGAGGATGLTAPASSAATSGGSQYALTAGGGGAGTGLTAGSSTLAPALGAPASSPGLVSGVWNSLGEYGKMAAVQGAGKIVEGAGQQQALKEQQEREDQLASDARARYNDNVGVMSFGSNFGQGSDGAQSTYAQAAPTGLVSGAMTPRQQYEEELRKQQESYSPYASTKYA